MIKSGQYASVGDYVRDLIHRDQTMADGRNALLAGLVKGEQSGKGRHQVSDTVESLKENRPGVAERLRAFRRSLSECGEHYPWSELQGYRDEGRDELRSR